MPEAGTTRRTLAELLEPRFLARLDGLDVLSRKILQGKLQGERRSKRRGRSVEFSDHRAYVAGDDLRFIDWHLYGRLEELFLKLFLEEQDLSVQVVLDASGSMDHGEPVKARAALQLAAALGYVAVVNNNRLSVTTVGEDGVRRLLHQRGRSSAARLAEFLLGLGFDGRGDFDAACRVLAESSGVSGVVVLLSDLLWKEGYEAPLRRLIGRGADLHVIQLLSPQELRPELAGDLKLLDTEDGDEAEVTVSPALLKYYDRILRAYCNEINTFCTARGAGYSLFETSGSVEMLVLNTLRREGVLG